MAVLTDHLGNPYLDVDDFDAAVPASWVLTGYSRYDPTHIDGTTPSGKAFSADLSAGTVSLTIAGNNRTSSVAKATWLSGTGTWTALTNLRATFPADQQ